MDRHPRFAADLTGDGTSDLVGFGNDGVWAYPNDGHGNFGGVRQAVADFGYKAAGATSCMSGSPPTSPATVRPT